jgi:branched-chain amino acid transport system substrate-binding protein
VVFRKVPRLAVAVSAALLAFTSGGWAAAASPSPINIGVVTSETGPLADYGLQEIRGFEIGLAYATHGTDTVNGHPIHVIIRDDKGDPATGLQAARDLILSDHVAMLQGAASSAVAIPLEQVAAQYHVPLVIDPAADDDLTTTYLNPYVFRTAVNTYMYAAAYAAYLKHHGSVKGVRFYQFAPQYSFGVSSVKDWAAALQAAGATNEGVLYAPITTTDFSSYIDHILSLNPRPQILVVTWAGVGAITLFQQMAQSELFQKMRVLGAVGSTDGLKALRQAANGFVGVIDYYYAIPHNPANRYLVSAYEAKYHTPPDLFSGTAFAAAQAMVQALQKAHGTSPSALTKALTGMTIDGPKGPITIRPADHQALQPMYVVRLVWNAKLGYAVPTLIETIPAQETAPPLH